MEFPISYPGFEGQNLTVKPAGFLGARLLQNGSPLKRQKGFYFVKNNAGIQVRIKLKSNFPDPIPKVIIDKDLIQLAAPLKWYEYLWMGLPILLIFLGGAVGGGIGGYATYTNGKIFRTQRSVWAKYGLTGLISIAAVIFYLVLGITLRILIAKYR